MVVLQDKGRPEVAQKKPCQSEVSVFNKVYKGTKVDSKSSLIIFGGIIHLLDTVELFIIFYEKPLSRI